MKENRSAYVYEIRKAVTTLNIEKIKRGDSETFSQIIDEYSGYLATVIRGIHPLSPHDIEDIIAETMLALWRNAARLKSETSFKSYLATIVRNKTIDHLRKKRVEILELDLNIASDTSIEGDYLRRETANLISQQIESIHEPDRTILQLKYHDGLKSKEIAEKLGLKPNVIDIRLSRQRAKLKKFLQEAEAIT